MPKSAAKLPACVSGLARAAAAGPAAYQSMVCSAPTAASMADVPHARPPSSPFPHHPRLMVLCPQARCLLQTQLQQALQLIEGLEREKREFTVKMDGYSETFATCQQSITHSHEVHMQAVHLHLHPSFWPLCTETCVTPPACSGWQARGVCRQVLDLRQDIMPASRS